MGFSPLNYTTKEFKPHARTHHVIIIVIIVTIAMLTLCYTIMSHATLVLFYHVSMLTLHNSLISRALWLHKHDITEFRM